METSRVRVAWSLAVVLGCLLAYGAIDRLTPGPRYGTGTQFWQIALDPSWSETTGISWVTTTPLDGAYFYGQSNCLEDDFFRVPISEIERELPQALAALPIDEGWQRRLKSSFHPWNDDARSVLQRLEALIEAECARASPTPSERVTLAMREGTLENRRAALSAWGRLSRPLVLDAVDMPWRGWEPIGLCGFGLLLFGTVPPWRARPAWAALRSLASPLACLTFLELVVGQYPGAPVPRTRSAFLQPPPIRSLFGATPFDPDGYGWPLLACTLILSGLFVLCAFTRQRALPYRWNSRALEAALLAAPLTLGLLAAAGFLFLEAEAAGLVSTGQGSVFAFLLGATAVPVPLAVGLTIWPLIAAGCLILRLKFAPLEPSEDPLLTGST